MTLLYQFILTRSDSRQVHDAEEYEPHSLPTHPYSHALLRHTTDAIPGNLEGGTASLANRYPTKLGSSGEPDS